jgi:hypothetical protein
MARLLCRIMWSQAEGSRLYDTDADTRKEFLRAADVVLAWLAEAKGTKSVPAATGQKPPQPAPASGRARLMQGFALSPLPAPAPEIPLPPLSIPTPAADRPERKTPPTLQAPPPEPDPQPIKAPGAWKRGISRKAEKVIQTRADDMLRRGSQWDGGLPGLQRLWLLQESRALRENRPA